MIQKFLDRVMAELRGQLVIYHAGKCAPQIMESEFATAGSIDCHDSLQMILEMPISERYSNHKRRSAWLPRSLARWRLQVT